MERDLRLYRDRLLQTAAGGGAGGVQVLCESGVVGGAAVVMAQAGSPTLIPAARSRGAPRTRHENCRVPLRRQPQMLRQALVQARARLATPPDRETSRSGRPGL